MKQGYKRIALVALILLSAVTLFPCRKWSDSLELRRNGKVINPSRSFFHSSPRSAGHLCEIDMERVILEWAAIVFLAGALGVALGGFESIVRQLRGESTHGESEQDSSAGAGQ